jgi:OOP family OmpA-OmpF porin
LSACSHQYTFGPQSTIMKRISLLTILFLPFLVQAQLGGLINKAKNKVNQRIDRKVDKAMENELDRIEGKQTTTQSKPSEVNNEETNTPAGITSYARYDFVPGEKIVYAEDFNQDAVGELPIGWNTNNRGEVVTLNNIGGKWFRMIGNSKYLTSNKDTFSKNFSLEFDLVYNIEPNGYGLPSMKFGFLSTSDEATNDNKFLNALNQYAFCEIDLAIYPGGKKKYAEGFHALLKSHLNRKEYFKSERKSIDDLGKYADKISHVAVQVQGTRFRCWVNGFKVYDLPMAIPTAYVFNQLFFELERSNYRDDELGYYISNIKVATGKPDTRHKLIEEGKFTTTGILFDHASAVIKSESFGVIKEIATTLTENPSVRIKIIGHTSNDGDDAANMELSKQRSAAVKAYLLKEFSIADSRIETEGKGETQPVADNKLKEGKAQNRRVEFIKL